jgi:hypothetical protein
VKFKFSATDDGAASTTSSIEFEAEFVPDVLAGFHQFLRGAGFYLQGDHLIIAGDPEPDPPSIGRGTFHPSIPTDPCV